MSGKLSATEENALRFYIGDVSGDDDFYGDPKAYVVLNSLFFPDIATESARASEGKYLNPAIIADIPRLIDFFGNLFSAFRKSALEENVLTYRVERMADYKLCRERSMTVSMTSTSTGGFLNAYRDRKGIALMKFNLPEGSCCIDVGKALPHYAKPEEAEILLPPFMKLDIAEIQPTESELLITDSDNQPPQVSCIVGLLGIEKHSGDTLILSADGSEAGQRVYKALNSGEIPDNSDVEQYSCWKSDLQKILYSMI
ncbi:MAG: hypothetical protein NC340_09905 [Ruminococcus flavefaciens]|nr:hypothetical protein [Ruminococcus flavefaciens]MCM1231383.1 hypothetical protein [Ruminococcus flavefaciens]